MPCSSRMSALVDLSGVERLGDLIRQLFLEGAAIKEPTGHTHTLTYTFGP